MAQISTVDSSLRKALELPVADQEYYFNAWRQWSVVLRKHPDAPLLKPAQGAVLEHLHQGTGSRGVFCNIGVGGGKTLIAMLAPYVAGAKRPVLLLPAGLDQAFDEQFEVWKEHYPVVRPTIVSYNELSSPDNPTLLDELRPDLIIADEAHKLRWLDTSRTKRLVRYHAENPDCRMIFMSGTITGGSVRHYAHLLYMALRDQTPGPRSIAGITAWATVIDPNVDETYEQNKAFQPLFEWAGDYDPERAFRERVRLTPGVVYTRRASVDASIHLRRLTRPEPSDAVTSALRRLKGSWELPDGTMLIEASAIAAAERQMSAGFWYLPGDIPSQEWWFARQNWERELRVLMKYRSRKNFDSPKLIEDALRNGTWSGYSHARRALFEWDKHRHIKRPNSEPVWLDKEWAIEPAREFARSRKGIIWYYHQPVADALEEAGLKVYRAGDSAPVAGETDVACLSLSRFKNGFNLQYHNDMLFLEVRPSGTDWDQAIGRQHREGQQSDTVSVDVLQRTYRQKADLDRAIANAESMVRQTGQPHKLLLATREWVR